MRLYIWKIDRGDWEWDTYSDAIVVAKNEADARLIHPDGEGSTPETWNMSWGTWPVKPEDLTVTKVGTAMQGIEAGTVLCASFHAG